MADKNRSRAENAPGAFFVDETCIDCDTCRWMAPSTFNRQGEMAAVHSQPATPAERLIAHQAMLSCPTASIGCADKDGLAEAISSFPIPVDGRVFHCGFHDEKSYGAASYLIVRPEGNILIDAPRFAAPLIRHLERLGGVETLFLTHKDDVGDHEKFRKHFNCERIIHGDDATGDLLNIETLLTGEDEHRLADDIVIVPVPGHTRGSAVLIHQERHLFSGDHVAWSPRLGQVYAFKNHCWFDWDTQIRSMERLADYRFQWILPGHGRRCTFEQERMTDEMRRAVSWMRSA